MPKGKALPVELLWKARQMYEEKWTEEDAKQHPVRAGERKWSQMKIAAHLGISETSVLRAITNTGRFAVMGNAPLPTTRTDEELLAEARESEKRFVARMQADMAAEKAEITPGQTRADKILEELEKVGPVSDAVKDRAKGLL